jgi:hypothetical protein
MLLLGPRLFADSLRGPASPKVPVEVANDSVDWAVEEVRGVGRGRFEDVTLMLLMLCSLTVRERVAPSMPPPLIKTGSRRLERKSSNSRSGRLDDILLLLLETERDVLRVVLVDRVRMPLALLALDFLPRCEYFPYPSWPVPAAGPFLVCRAGSSEPVSRSGFDFFVKRPNFFCTAGFFKSGFSFGFSFGGSLVNVLGDFRVNTGDPASLEGIRDRSLDNKESVEATVD